jgi:hypothetical protein
MLFSYRYGQQHIGDNKKCMRIAGDFDLHRPKEHIQGLT